MDKAKQTHKFTSADATETQLSSLCHKRHLSDSSVEDCQPTRKSRQARGRRKPRSPELRYEDDSPSLGLCKYFLPSETSDWTINCLELLDIVYNHEYTSPSNMLDLVFKATGLFGQLTGDQQEHVKRLQNYLNFSTSIRSMLSCTSMLTVVKPNHLATEMKKDIANIKSKCRTSIEYAEDLITLIELMVAYQTSYLKSCGIRETQGPVSGDVFADIFKAFVKMCQLLPIPGSAWKGKMDIYHGRKKIPVTSSPDIVIFPQKYCNDVIGNEATNSLFVVSVVEANKLKSLITKTERSDSESSSEAGENVYKEPYIYEQIEEGILGQHGGELLLHHMFYRDEFRTGVDKFMPGIIVCGTEVTFTLLVINTDHLRGLKLGGKPDPERKAWIHYSKPLDLLKKEDRDILVVSLARLNNV